MFNMRFSEVKNNCVKLNCTNEVNWRNYNKLPFFSSYRFMIVWESTFLNSLSWDEDFGKPEFIRYNNTCKQRKYKVSICNWDFFVTML